MAPWDITLFSWMGFAKVMSNPCSFPIALEIRLHNSKMDIFQVLDRLLSQFLIFQRYPLPLISSLLMASWLPYNTIADKSDFGLPT